MVDRYNVTIPEDRLRAFYDSFERGGEDECWIWKASLSSQGYGTFVIRTVYFGAHQIALILSGKPRPLPPEHCALHSCDNPPCVNPAHLSWGSHKRNSQEREDRNRRPRGVAKGEKITHSLLTAEKVREIRRSSLSTAALAEAFGVRYMVVWKVRKGLTWMHVQ